jgi:hypothetical protein
MRKGSPIKSKRNTLSFDILLPDTTHDLRYVDVGTFGSCTDHVLDLIPGVKVLERQLTSFISGPVKVIIDFELKRLKQVLARLELKLTSLSPLDSFAHFLSVEVKLINNALHSLLACNGILDAYCEAMDCKPLVDNILCPC